MSKRNGTAQQASLRKGALARREARARLRKIPYTDQHWKRICESVPCVDFDGMRLGMTRAADEIWIRLQPNEDALLHDDLLTIGKLLSKPDVAAVFGNEPVIDAIDKIERRVSHLPPRPPLSRRSDPLREDFYRFLAWIWTEHLKQPLTYSAAGPFERFMIAAVEPVFGSALRPGTVRDFYRRERKYREEEATTAAAPCGALDREKKSKPPF
jgi:hypothetical protein